MIEPSCGLSPFFPATFTECSQDQKIAAFGSSYGGGGEVGRLFADKKKGSL
jgi:hypothetical protein